MLNITVEEVCDENVREFIDNEFSEYAEKTACPVITDCLRLPQRMRKKQSE